MSAGTSLQALHRPAEAIRIEFGTGLAQALYSSSIIVKP